jgi:type II secretory ATPase GspE/PulE/Tfp pilus assembly ATPase PilB-like protein
MAQAARGGDVRGAQWRAMLTQGGERGGRGHAMDAAPGGAAGHSMQGWPLPPFLQDLRGADDEAPEAVLFLLDGQAVHGRLQRFQPETQSLVLLPRGASAGRTLRFGEFKSLQLLVPVVLAVDAELVEQYLRLGGHLAALEARGFTVRFLDGEQLQGTTKGFVRSRVGLFIFLITSGEQVIRIFVPVHALADFQIGGLLGQHLVARGYVRPEELAQALQEQERRRQLAVDEHLGDVPDPHVRSLAAQLTQVGSIPSARLGDILVNQGLVTREQMLKALQQMRQNKTTLLGQVLVDMGVLSRAQLTQAVAEQLNIPLVRLRDFQISPEVLDQVPREFALEHGVLPLLMSRQALVVAVESPIDADFLDDLRFKTQRQVIAVMADGEELQQHIRQAYEQKGPGATDFQTIPAELEQLKKKIEEERQAADGTGGRIVSDDDSLVVRLVNQMILDAQRQGASDIHIEAYPGEQDTRIRFRIDGSLTDYMRVPYVLRAALVSRIKIMANLDISEHRLPQDGKIDFSSYAATRLELRVACLPTAHGLQDVVLRLLASSKPIPLEQLGMETGLIEQLREMVHRSYGLILVCGPTGSGKTTTLHSLLAEVNTPENKIWTAEDPIEITHPGLRQIQMVPRIGLTFATAMRAFLRADPDIIMVGEMRDAETAHIAIEASLTGHLVLSTLHTNSAPESVVRLLDMGLDPFNFADALIGVLGQRLARRLCKQCKAPAPDAEAQLQQMLREYLAGSAQPPQELLAQWRQRYGAAGGGAITLYQPVGCAACNHTGYKGRLGIYELMSASPAIKKLIQTRAPVEQLFATAAREGMLRLAQYGILKVLEGVTDYRSVHMATH